MQPELKFVVLLNHHNYDYKVLATQTNVHIVSMLNDVYSQKGMVATKSGWLENPMTPVHEVGHI